MDWAEVARSYGEEFQRSGGEIKLNFEVRNDNTVNAHTPSILYESEKLVITLGRLLIISFKSF